MSVLRKYRVPIILALIACIALGIFLQVRNGTETAPTVSEKPKVYKGAEPDNGVSLSDIQDGNYYILHKGKAYPINSSIQTNGTDAATSQTDATRLLMTDSAGTKNIPTLYLGDGDKLIYRSSESAIDTIRFERYKDEGYSFGIYGITEQANKTYTMVLGSSDTATTSTTGNIRPGSSAQMIASALTNSKSTYTFGSIGTGKKAVQISEKLLAPAGFVKSSVLVSNPKAGTVVPEERTYALNIYAGTEKHTFNIKSDTHFFSGMELYAEYTKGLDTASTYQELEIPDYLPDGYYVPNFGGLFRLVHGTKYTDDAENFNKRQLEVSKVRDDETYEDVDSPTGQTACYSSDTTLNSYSTTNPDAFGYSRDLKTTDSSDDTETVEAENTTRDYHIKPEKGKSYTFTITTQSDKGTVSYETPEEGWAFTMKANGDGTSTYTSTITGDGKTNTIHVKGFDGTITADLNGAEVKSDAEQSTDAADSEDTKSDDKKLTDAVNEASDE